MLIRKIEVFLRRTGMPETAFGRNAANDPRLVRDLRAGRSPRETTEKRCEAFMAEYYRDEHKEITQ